MRYLLIVAALVTMGAACEPKKKEAAPAIIEGVPATRVEDAAFVVDGATIQLTDGYFIVMVSPESTVAVVTRLFGRPVPADLDADGDMDAAVMLSKEAPGAATEYYVAAAVKQDGGYVGTAAIPLGSEIAPQTTEARDSVVIVNYGVRGADSSSTSSPTVGVSEYFRLEGGALKEIPKP